MTDTLAVARSARPSQRPARSPWWALAVVLTGQFMAVLDASVVNVAAPSIHASLHTSGAGLQLVIAGYVITYAVLLVTGARLGDILGHRRMFLAGLAAFTLASLGCGLATSTVMLVTLRCVQGGGAAAMIPQVSASSSGPSTARPGPARCGCTRPSGWCGDRAGRRRRAGQREPARRHLAPGLPAERSDQRDLVPRRAAGLPATQE
jgi:hypothetical protein